MFTPSSSGVVKTAYNRHAASSHARHQGRQQPSVARKNCRSRVPAGQNAGTLTSAAATVRSSHWLRLQAPRCPCKNGQWNCIRSAPHLTIGAYAVLFCARTLAYRPLAKALSFQFVHLEPPALADRGRLAVARSLVLPLRSTRESA